MARLVIDLDQLEADLGAEVRALLLEVANEFVNNLRREAPTGATGDLRRSMQIFRANDGRVVLGSRIGYAMDVNDGTAPHVADFDQIQVWARRVLGDQSAAGPVWRKIAEEGTDANPYVDRAMDATIQQFR